MKLKRVFAVLFSIVVLSGCKAGKIEKKDPKTKSDIPIVSESSDKLVKDNIPVTLPDLDTEKGVKEYFVGEWVYDEEYGTDVVCKMNIDKNLNVQLSFYDTYMEESKGEYTGKIKFEWYYVDPDKAPDFLRLELTDTDELGGEFFFLHRTVYDGKRVMSWFFAGKENCIFNVLGPQGYEDAGMGVIPGVITFKKATGEMSQLKPRKNDHFYAVYWGKDEKGKSLWLDDALWIPTGEDDYTTVYPKEINYYDDELQESILYSISPEEILDILGDDLFPGSVYYVETDEKGNITHFIGAESKEFLEESAVEYETETLIFDIIYDVEEIQEYLDMGMRILYNGETITLDGEECYIVELGTDYEEQFVREIFYAVNINTYQVYHYDVLTDTWEPVAMG